MSNKFAAMTGCARGRKKDCKACKKMCEKTRGLQSILVVAAELLVKFLDNEAHRVDTKIQESYYKSQHTGSFSKRRKKRARCADSYELILRVGLGRYMKLNRRNLSYGNVMFLKQA